jgi:hypothetical protein
MPFLIVLLALFTPRLVVVLLWLFTDWFNGIFGSLLWPVLGFIFLPTTLFWYTAVVHWFGGQWTLWPIMGIAVALVIDFSPTGGYRKKI